MKELSSVHLVAIIYNVNIYNAVTPSSSRAASSVLSLNAY